MGKSMLMSYENLWLCPKLVHILRIPLSMFHLQTNELFTNDVFAYPIGDALFSLVFLQEGNY